jgi:hypothetical protein
MDLLVLKKLLEMLECFATLVGEAFKLLATNSIFDDVRELIFQYIFNCLFLFRLLHEGGVQSYALFQVCWLLFLHSATRPIRELLFLLSEER